MRHRGALVVCAVFAGTMSAGCSSAYLPRRSAHLSMRMDSGSLVFERDGQKFEGGLFGGDLDEAVKGVPLAEKFASDYKTGVTGGFVLALAGGAAAIGGSSLAGAEYAQRTSNVPGWTTVGAGLVAYFIGLAWIMSSQPHLYDAINAYNDAADERAEPAAAPAPQSLAKPSSAP
jgi:hypothetical protein